MNYNFHRVLLSNTYEWANSWAAVVMPLNPPLSLTSAFAYPCSLLQAPWKVAMPDHER